MKSLRPEDFADFFEGVHGTAPFPWQVQLAERVIGDGKWPSLLDLPTGTGKTAAIDVAIFHLACEASKGQARSAPLRVLFVIDRRIVVDAAFERARKIARALSKPANEVIAAIAGRLSLLSGRIDHPLDVVRLRGGTPQERGWARTPAQPLVVVSTVDQVGSRLLFRGYGVSGRMRPVHAGLVGSDALWLLDEVHLSKPLEETLDAIVFGHKEEGGNALAIRQRLAPFAVVKLSATPGAGKPVDWFPGKARSIRLGAPPELLARLDSRKRAALTCIEGSVADGFARCALGFAGILKTDDRDVPATKRRVRTGTEEKVGRIAKRVAVVVNRVDLAREVYNAVLKLSQDRSDVFLLMGRIRPIDRDAVLDGLNPFFASANRSEPERPLILVATQCIEAGADFDVEALVTEIAPLDSLRQRFGRLDRLGLQKEALATIVYPAGKLPKGDSRKTSPWMPILRIYGESAYRTKEWLETLGPEIDFGIEAMEATLAALPKATSEQLLAPRPRAPVFLSPYADLLAKTWPEPVASPDPSLFLHGPNKYPDVSIVWRADIDPSDEATARLSLKICPPSSLEALSVPVWAVRNWLKGEMNAPGPADVPEDSVSEFNRDKRVGYSALSLKDGEWTEVFAMAISPGTLIVVPSDRRGCDKWGWNPLSTTHVTDVGAIALYRQRLKGALRITQQTLANAREATELSEPIDGAWDRISAFIRDLDDEVNAELVRAFLAANADLPEEWRRILIAMEHRQSVVEFYDDEERTKGFIIFARKPLPAGLFKRHDEETMQGADAVTERLDSSFIGVEVALRDHLLHVEKWAREFAGRVGLPERLIDLIGLAARLHDLGKADPRFQADLKGWSALAIREPELAALLTSDDRLVAKSWRTETVNRLRRGDRASPDDFRHEALSVALATKHPSLAELTEEEQDLLLWLIGTHHGFGRPFFPPSKDPAPQTVAKVEIDGHVLVSDAGSAPLGLDQGWCERMDRLVRFYGPWELARLEAIVRLADHQASAEEQQRPVKQSGPESMSEFAT